MRSFSTQVTGGGSLPWESMFPAKSPMMELSPAEDKELNVSLNSLLYERANHFF